MFNRKIQIDLVKKQKEANPTSPLTSDKYPDVSPIVDITESVKQVTETVGRTIVAGLLVYIAADTARQVIVKSTKEG